ncbi:Phosphatidylglycerol lysyltransferase [Pleomorphomonas sp. T1.2MG-36]|uniref:bifunctional lysylphosphatidylglycerol flippase/synthetase MprF n=1 Tax=Pleomorphomonas sp. T1.2MG-36 TaxID=3041167 RepID=UPI002477C29D|nr:bifunctional lysylphosphatidylglycerol flippase/synthetase MprF [Pleomorphomonas sp. T1.2MG-36]CAI9402105.1 Phosphatidylglycerol lysyltransferase [Pleomorphomonas sp. T1.2MG-36]
MPAALPSESAAIPAVHVHRLARLKPFIVAVVALLIVGLSVLALSRLLSNVVYDDLIEAIDDTPWSRIGLALMFTAGSFLALSIYDVHALRFAGARLPYRLVALASFCAYAVGNIAGFGPLTGGSVRYRFYSPFGLEPEAIAKVVAYVAAAFGFGLAFVAGLGLTIAGPDLASLIGMSGATVRGIGLLALAGVGAVLLLAALRRGRVTVFGRAVALPDVRDVISQLLATSVDVICAAAVLYVLLPDGDVSFLVVLAVFSVAVGAGVLSHLPGGVGIFETIVVGALGTRLPIDGVISALLIYRIVYYVVPLVVAVVAMIVSEARRATMASPALMAAVSGIAPVMLGTLAMVLGAMLVFSGVTPPADTRLDLMSSFFPLPLVEGAHFVGSVIGVFLLVAGRGLVHRLDGAWWLTLSLTALSIPLGLLKALAVGEAILMAILIVGLVSSRHLYNRPASLLHDRLSPAWWLCIASILALALGILFFVYKEVPYSHDLWWQFEMSAAAPRSLRAAVGIGLATAAVATWLLIRPPSGRIEPANSDDLARAVAILASAGHASANLVRMGDKNLMFSDDGAAFLMYAKRGRSWISLGDPVGPEAGQRELAWRFIEMARAHGGRAVFYQVPAESLSLYADAGLSAFKLGEEAVVDLAAFDIKGTRRGNLRNAINKAERDGIVFEVVPPEAVPAIMDELVAVSASWLKARKAREKTFSLGAFETDYVASQPVAVLKRVGRIFAFATLMVSGDGQEAAIDLMRFTPKSPNGTMELLFTRVLLHFKAAGFRDFSLGMAPLAGLSDSPMAPLWHKLGRAAFEHGNAFYNFHGLRAFKTKFDPVWRQRYMAVAGGLNPLLALADVTFIISGGLKGAVSK